MQPKVGSKVQVITHNHSAVDRNLFPDTPTTNHYAGIVLQSEKDDDVNTFRLTGDDTFPIRVIALRNVVSVDGLEVYMGSIQRQEHIVTVEGSKGDEYVVTIGANGKNTCTCPAFSYRKMVCKHITNVLEPSARESKE